MRKIIKKIKRYWNGQNSVQKFQHLVFKIFDDFQDDPDASMYEIETLVQILNKISVTTMRTLARNMRFWKTHWESIINELDEIEEWLSRMEDKVEL